MGTSWVQEDLLFHFSFQAKSGVLPITNPEMTRFFSLEQSVEMVLWSLSNTLGGELLVPKLPSYTFDLADAIGPSCSKNVIGTTWRKITGDDCC